MTTKAQERKALEQIRKIVEGLGEDSYIGMAFEGCFEIAEENIENDWGCSMKQRYETAEKQRQQNSIEILDLREARDAAIKRAKEAEDMFNKAQGRIDSWVAKCHEAEDANDHNAAQVIVQQERIAAQEREIITLKAKLYDLMMA